LHRCPQRHGISRLPDVEGVEPAKKFKSYPISTFQRFAPNRESSTCSWRSTAPPNLPTSSRTKTPPPPYQGSLLRLIAAVPYKIHTVLTDNGIQFITPGAGDSTVPLIKEAIANGEPFWAHAFELACPRNGIDHYTTKVKHPWTNGQVERINRTIKDATVRHFYYESHGQLRRHLADFISTYNFGRRLADSL
jgi:transposase InsO family protein